MLCYGRPQYSKFNEHRGHMEAVLMRNSPYTLLTYLPWAAPTIFLANAGISAPCGEPARSGIASERVWAARIRAGGSKKLRELF